MLSILMLGIFLMTEVSTHTAILIPPAPLTDFWRLLEDAQSALQKVLSQLPQRLIQDLLFNAEHYNQKAKVRFTPNDSLSAEEKAFLAKRRERTSAALETFLGKPLKKPLSIGISFSGGGFRAMVATLGFLKGAQEIGLLDGTDFMAGLSGSTWAIASWIASQKSIQDYLSELSVRLHSGIQPLSVTQDLEKIVALFMIKALFGQTINAMDIYGALLANILLKDSGDNRFRETFGTTHKHMLDGSMPFPIYTAVQSNIRPYEWAEVTPYEVGSSYLKSYIPTWSYGRTFNAGVSTDNAPQQTLGYFMGVFGSAFEASVKDAIENSAFAIQALVDNVDRLPVILEALFGPSTWYTFTVKALKAALPGILKNFLDDLNTYLHDSEWSTNRFFPDWQPNFTYKLQGVPENINELERITFIDGGFDFNLPIPALLRPARNVDVLIVCDVSSSIGGPEGALSLKRAEEYAQKRGLKFPKIDPLKAVKKAVSVFNDPNDPEVPTVIYFPLIANPDYSKTFDPKTCTSSGYCGTLNFEYTPDNVRELAGLAEFTLKQNAGVIKKALLAL